MPDKTTIKMRIQALQLCYFYDVPMADYVFSFLLLPYTLFFVQIIIALLYSSNDTWFTTILTTMIWYSSHFLNEYMSSPATNPDCVPWFMSKHGTILPDLVYLESILTAGVFYYRSYNNNRRISHQFLAVVMMLMAPLPYLVLMVTTVSQAIISIVLGVTFTSASCFIMHYCSRELKVVSIRQLIRILLRRH